MTKRTEETINILLNAFNSGTLAAGSCMTCAVGTICKHYCGDSSYWKWGALFKTNGKTGTQFKKHKGILTTSIKEGRKAISKTPFTEEELAEIEFAFEMGSYKDYWTRGTSNTLKGLEEVIKVLLKFDEDEESKVKEVFTSKVRPELLLS